MKWKDTLRKTMSWTLLGSTLWMHGCANNGEFIRPDMAGGSPEEYVIAPSDVIEITVYGEESLTRKELVVRPDGKVSFPLIGDVEAGGLTTSQAKELVQVKVRDFIPGAVADVGVVQLGSLQYYVVGKVAKPGMFNVSKSINVLQALALAGGLSTFAKENQISILRNHGSETTRLPFNYDDVKRGKNLEQNILLNRGDVIVVP
jgi:polysaccharide biosynthesis/export protein